MSKKVLVLMCSPKKDGNTAFLVKWFAEGARPVCQDIEVVNAAELEHKANGCTSCRACQKSGKYECVIKDGISDVLLKMAAADIIVFATPLYFFSASAQLKLIMDRMFSLYKWDNEINAFETPLKGKTMVLMASAYEDAGLGVLERPFTLTAKYTGMRFESLLVPNAGVSGDIVKIPGIEEKTREFGRIAVS